MAETIQGKNNRLEEMMANAVADKTADIIIAMLKENTGIHFLDSGGAYGRHYEKNQGRDFKSEKPCEAEINEWKDGNWEVSLSYNIFHFLNNYLEHNKECEKLGKSFLEFCETPEYKDKAWLECMEAWAATVHEEGQHPSPYTENTYNYDNLLSQVIQFTTFEKQEKTYILLQIHGGCDERGGYTKPRIFLVPDTDYFRLAMFDVSAWCPKCHAHWYSDDSGYHFYNDEKDKPKWSETKYGKRTKALKCPCGGKIEFGVSESS